MNLIDTAISPLIVMGVQGTGKSTIGKMLADELGIKFIDGDDLHPVGNKRKMGSGIPLEDSDRLPWLTDIGETLAKDYSNGVSTLIVCSALKRWYRELLRYYSPEVKFIHLHGAKDLVRQRITKRNHEYMPESLLDSQYAILQPLAPHENGVTVSIEGTPEEIVQNIIAEIAL